MTTIVLNHTGKVEKDYSKMTISELAWTCNTDWRKQGGVHVYAQQQLNAMMTMTTANDSFGADSGKGVIASFLSNAQTWKGEVARAVKKELNKRLK